MAALEDNGVSPGVAYARGAPPTLWLDHPVEWAPKTPTCPGAKPPHTGHRARLRARAAISFEALPDYELLELILARGLPRGDTKPTAKALLARFGSLAGVLGAGLAELRAIDGIGPGAALDLKLVHEATVRMSRGEVAKRPVISSWSALLAYARAAMAHEAREQFRVLFLDKKNQLIVDEVMWRGAVDHAPVYPREVMRRALELSASAVILVHNHPSGDPTPSAADIDMTRQVVEAGRPLKIAVHDHLVVGREGVASFKALGLI
ncbi:MAG: RadC family protein [Caulobacteraceae bacterium]